MTLEERAKQYLDNGFGEDCIKFHRRHVLELMVNFSKDHASAKLAEAGEKAKIKWIEYEVGETLDNIPLTASRPEVDKESITSIPLD